MKEGSRKDRIWTSKFTERVSALIETGLLKKGVDALLKEVNKTSLPEEPKLSRAKLLKHLEQLIWTKERLNLVTKFVRLGASLTLLYKELSMLPKDMIDRRAKKLRGLSVRTVAEKGLLGAGVGRLVTDEEVKGNRKPIALQSYRLDNPFSVPVRHKENFRFLLINGAHLGLEYNRVIEENTLRNMFREAVRNNDDAIFLTGALLWLDTQQSAGRLTTHRALYSGLDFDVRVLPPAYREEAERIHKMKPANEVSFVKLRERVLNALGGWEKVTRHKDGTAIFPRKVYFSFGIQDEELIESAAQAHIRYVTTVMRNDVMVERKQNEAILVKKLKESGGHETSETRALRQTIEELLEKEKRMVQSNVEHEDRKRLVDAIRSVLISWLKKAIPNSEFLSQGSVVCGVGEKTIEIIQAPDNVPTSSSLDGYMKVGGQRGLEGKLPDVALVAAPYNVDTRYAVIERMIGTKRAVTHAWQLPVAVDRDYIRGARPEMIKKSSPIERLVKDPGFEPGAFRLGYVSGVWRPDVLPLSLFRPHRPHKMSSGEITDYLYIIADSDNHSGQRSKEWVMDFRTGLPLPLEVAFSELLMRSFVEKGKTLPIHAFSNIGDNLQGHHFPTQMTVHPEMKTFEQAQAHVQKILKNAKSSGNIRDAQEALRRLGQEFLRQLILRGEDWPVHQLENFITTSLRPRVPLFAEILRNSQRVGLKIRGISEVLYGNGTEDARDLGVINWVGGDHFTHTVWEELTEGTLYRRFLIGLLLGEKSLGLSEEKIQKLVRAPLWGELPIGYGLMSVPGGYEWGMVVRHKPAKSSGQNGDRMGAITSNLLERGDYGRIFTGRNWFQLSGHIHFYAAAFSRNKFMVSCASSTDGDAFGDRLGFRRSNSGAMVVGIPARGPEYGPIRVISFPHSFLRAYFEEPWKIDWASVFPDPVGS